MFSPDFCCYFVTDKDGFVEVNIGNDVLIGMEIYQFYSNKINTLT